MGNNWFQLTKNNLYFLFSYYLILLFLGLFIGGTTLINISFLKSFTITAKALFGSIGFSLIGSTIYYQRKLYKSCINGSISDTEDPKKYFNIGVLFYFILRPIFSIAFSVLIVLFLKESVFIITIKDTQLDEGFIYLSLTISFFGGFSAGRFLEGLDNKGKEILDNLLKRV